MSLEEKQMIKVDLLVSWLPLAITSIPHIQVCLAQCKPHGSYITHIVLKDGVAENHLHHLKAISPEKEYWVNGEVFVHLDLGAVPAWTLG